MDMKEFASNVAAALEKQLDCTVKIDTTLKNNNVSWVGLRILEANCNTTPNIYLDPFWESYQNGGDFNEIIDEIISCYQQNKLGNMNMGYFMDYEKVKDSIRIKVINREKNSRLLEQVPWEPFLDLAVVYYSEIENELIGKGTILIHNIHVENWGISKDELAQTALLNMLEKVIYKSFDLAELISQMKGEDISEIENIGCPDMRVVTNEEKLFGAAAILRKDVIQGIAKQYDSDIVIIPSSLHEIIVLPYKDEEDVKIVRAMVYEVNRLHMDYTEVLSDNVYIYDRKQNDIRIV